jgi:diguanylate cyclase
MMKPTEQSLADRMQVHELEIAHRKRLLDFTPQDAARLGRAGPLIREDVDAIVAEFYEHQIAIDELALIIGDSDTLRRLRDAQRGYIHSLFSGYYEEEYVNSRLRIGLVHKRIGVEPKHYLAAVKLLKEMLRAAIKHRMTDPHELAGTLEALDKLLYLDMQLVFDTYIHSMTWELEATKEKALEYARSLEAKVEERTRELANLSRTDALTGLLNQRAFREDLRREIERAKRTELALTLIFLDMDGFKAVNDAKGHAEGDETLHRIGRAIRALIREVDIAGRYGGDEFCIVLPGADLDGAQQFVQRLRTEVRVSVELTFSAGVVVNGPQEFYDADELLHIADQRMYAAKRNEANQPVEVET